MNAISPDLQHPQTQDAATANPILAMLEDVIQYGRELLELLHRRSMAAIQAEIAAIDAGEQVPRRSTDGTLAISRLVRSLCQAATLHGQITGVLRAARGAAAAATTTPPLDPRTNIVRLTLREAAGVDRAVPLPVRLAIAHRTHEILAADPQGRLKVSEIIGMLCGEFGLTLKDGGAPAGLAGATGPAERAAPAGLAESAAARACAAAAPRQAGRVLHAAAGA